MDSQDASLARLFPGDGEMPRRMRAIDWAATALGPVDGWPGALRIALGMCLTSRVPMAIAWGPELTIVCNDAYAAVVGGAAAEESLGRSARTAWAAWWERLAPAIETVVRSAAAAEVADVPLPAEVAFVTFALSPILGESGRVDGVLCVCTETTADVIGRRRMAMLRRLGAATADVRDVSEACRAAVAVLSDGRPDLPFAAIYAVADGGGRAELSACTGVDATVAEAWPAGEWLGRPEASALVEVAIGGGRQQAMVWPMRDASGVVVLGVSARRRLDDAGRGFLALVAGQVAAAIAGARAEAGARRVLDAFAEAPAAIAILRGRELVCVHANARYRELLGEPDPIGRPARRILPGEGVPTPAEVADACADRGATLAGTCRGMDWTCRPIRDGVLVFAVDAAGAHDVLAAIGGDLRRAVDRSALADDVLALARHAPGPRQRVELAEVVREAAAGRELRADVPSSLAVDADRAGLVQMLGHLIGHAAAHAPSSVPIDVSAARDGSEVVLAVRAAGLDRAADAAARGLAFARHLAHRHGGHVDDGDGTLTLRLPVAAGSDDAEPTASTSHVLLVDDNRDSVDALATLLRMSGFVITVAYDGPSALRLVEELGPDAAVVDIGLPTMDGYQVAEALRRRFDPERLRLIALTGHGQAKDRARALQAGFDLHLRKPVKLTDLIVALEG